jgi:hypothetical protein
MGGALLASHRPLGGLTALVRTMLVVACLATFPLAARAQYANRVAQARFQQMRAQIMQMQVVDVKGTVDEVDDGALKVKCEDQQYVVTLLPTFSHVQCSGTADRSFLKPGVLVKFEGEFDKKGQAKEPIEQLAIVTESETSQPGIHSDAPVDEEEQPRANRKGQTETYVVVGTIKMIKDTQMQVVTEEEKPIRLQLAKDAEIKVEVDDYSLASSGDEITIKGRQAVAPLGQQPGQIYAEEVTITLAKPLESDSKAPAKKKKSSKSTKRQSR